MTLRSIRTHLAGHWPLWLLGAAVAIHLAMMGSLFWGYIDSLFNNSDLEHQGLDFFSIYEAGHRVIENESAYGVETSLEPAVPYFTLYRYVPLFAYVFGAPANLLSPWSAYWAWVAFMELLLVASAYASWRLAGRDAWGAVAAAMWLVFTPFYQEQYFGQFSFLMGLSLFWVGVALVRGGQGLAVGPWALSLVTKSNSALLGPLFVRLGWWRVLIAGGLALAVNIPYFLWRPEDWDFFYNANFGGQFRSAPRFLTYIPGDLGGAAFIRNLVLIIDDSARDVSGVYVTVLTAVLLAASLAATLLPRKIDPLALHAVWISVYFLAWTVWEHHYMMYLPVPVLLVLYRPELRWAALAIFILVAIPTPYWLLNHVWNTGPINTADPFFMHQNVWPDWGIILYHAAKPGPIFALWAYLVVTQFRDGFSLSWVAELLAPLRRIEWLPMPR